jgi:hypothetical protein
VAVHGDYCRIGFLHGKRFMGIIESGQKRGCGNEFTTPCGHGCGKKQGGINTRQQALLLVKALKQRR